MNRELFLKELKVIMESEVGCETKTTPKKGLGFVPYNLHGIKWGQVDADPAKDYIRLVFDLKPDTYSEEEIQRRTGLSVTPTRKITTGYRFKKADPGEILDQLTIFLKDNYIVQEADKAKEILEYTKEFVAQSSFKVQSSR